MSRPWGGRLSPSPASATLAEERRTLCELTLVRVVSILENYVLDLGRYELEGRLANAAVPQTYQPLVAHLREFRWEAVTGTGSWSKPLKLWDEALGVAAATSFKQWQALEFVRTTRNIIVHGLGAVDDKWFGTARSLRRVSSLGIAQAKAEGRIPVGPADVEQGLLVARSFVFWLDEERSVL